MTYRETQPTDFQGGTPTPQTPEARHEQVRSENIAILASLSAEDLAKTAESAKNDLRPIAKSFTEALVAIENAQSTIRRTARTRDPVAIASAHVQLAEAIDAAADCAAAGWAHFQRYEKIARAALAHERQAQEEEALIRGLADALGIDLEDFDDVTLTVVGPIPGGSRELHS